MTSHQGSDVSLSGLPFSSSVYHASTLEESLRVPALLSLLGRGMITDATTDALSTIAVYPLALVATRLQIQRKKRRDGHKVVSGTTDRATGYKEILATAREIYEREGGLKGLYAGSLEAAIKVAIDTVLRILTYTILHRRVLRLKGLKPSESLSTLDRATVGLLAELATISLTAPIGTVITRKQAAGGPSRKRASAKGLKGLWAGYSASLLLALKVPLNVFVHEALKIVIFRSRKPNISALSTYVLWAMSHAAASSITYPVAVLKSRAQASPQPRNRGTTAGTELAAHCHVLRGVAQSEGPGALYPGLTAEIIRIFMNYGTTALFRSLIVASLPSAHHLFSSLFEGRDKLEVRARTDGHADGIKDIPGKPEAEAEAAGIMVPHRTEAASHTTQSSGGSLSGWGCMNATAELVGDYVEDEAQNWRSFYHWFWDPEWRRGGN